MMANFEQSGEENEMQREEETGWENMNTDSVLTPKDVSVISDDSDDKFAKFAAELAAIPKEEKHVYSGINFSDLKAPDDMELEYSEFHEQVFSPASVSDNTVKNIAKVRNSKMTEENFDKQEAYDDVRRIQNNLYFDIEKKPNNISSMKLMLGVTREIFLEHHNEDAYKDKYDELDKDVDDLYNMAGRERLPEGSENNREPAGALIEFLDRISTIDDEKLTKVLNNAKELVLKMFGFSVDMTNKSDVSYETYKIIRLGFKQGMLRNELPVNIQIQLPYIRK